MRRNVIFITMALTLLLTAGPSFAKVDITPDVTLSEEYNDNIFLARSDKEEDYITTVSPGILIEYTPGSLFDMSLDYRLKFKFYSRNSEFNDTSLKDTQNINFRAQIKPLNRVFIDVFDTYKRTPIDIRRRFATGNAFQNMTENNVFTVSPYAEFPLSSTVKTTLGYKYVISTYSGDQNSDSQSHTAFLTLNKKISSRLDGEIRYKYYKYNPDPEENTDVIKDYYSHLGSFALSYRITPDFTVDGEIGKGSYNYKSGDDFDTDFWNIGTDYNFRITEGTSLGARYETALKDSSSAGVYKSRRADIYIKTGKLLKLSVNPYYSDDKYNRAGRKDTVTGVNANVSYPLAKKIDILLDGNWARQKFLPRDEKVRKYSAAAGLYYKFSQKLTSTLEYRHERRNSDIDTRDFTNNIATLLAKVVF